MEPLESAYKRLILVAVMVFIMPRHNDKNRRC